jgi:hypothetical protein
MLETEDGQERRLGALLAHPLFIMAATALVASWLVPAFTKQWQDRQHARDLKAELAAGLDEATTTTVVEARILIERRFRAALTTDARKAELAAAAPGGRRRAEDAYAAAAEHERDAGNAAYLELVADWLVTRSVTRSKLGAFFPDETLDARWETYANYVTRYVRLARATDPTQRRRYAGELGRFLGQPPSLWAPLADDPRELEGDAYADYVTANARISHELLEVKNELVVAVLASDVEGFSTDLRGLAEDLLPFLG